jgi:CheY-like chemotaxis protein
MGSDAVEAVRDGRKTDRPFSIAFVDMQLNSVLDGIETAERIRASVARIHIAIVAGRSTLHPVELATRIPPADRLSFVRKPFHPFEVQQLLLGCVHRQRIEARNSSLGNGDDDDRVANRIVLRAILDRLPVGVLVFDRRDKLIAVNAEMGRLYPDSSSLFVSGTEIGKIFQEFNLNEVVSSGVSGEQKLWQMGRGRWAKVIEGVAPNGETYCLFSDVTDLKNRDAALRRSRYEMHLTQVFATLCDTVGELLKDGTTATDTSVHAVERLRAVAKQQHLTPHIIRPSQYLSRILRRIRRRLPSGIELEMVVDAKL